MQRKFVDKRAGQMKFSLSQWTALIVLVAALFTPWQTSCCAALPVDYFQAVEPGQIETVQALLDQNQKINARNPQGLTALMIAAKKRPPETRRPAAHTGSQGQHPGRRWTPTG